jgi:hypothetical protein
MSQLPLHRPIGKAVIADEAIKRLLNQLSRGHEDSLVQLDHAAHAGNEDAQPLLDAQLEGNRGHWASAAGSAQPHTDLALIVYTRQFDVPAVRTSVRLHFVHRIAYLRIEGTHFDRLGGLPSEKSREQSHT